jgi:Family of unknown function (DUF5320)
MPNRDGTGPRGGGRVNRRSSGQCRQNETQNNSTRRNQRLQSFNASGLPGGRSSALLGLFTAVLPIVLKAVRLIGRSGEKNRDVIEKPATKAVIIEHPPQLPDKASKT